MKINEILTESLDPRSWYSYLAKLMPNFKQAYQQVAQQKDQLKSVVNSLSSRDQAVTKDTVKAAVARAFPTADLEGTVVDRLASAVAAEAAIPALTEVVGMFGIFLIMLIAFAIGRDSNNKSNNEFACDKCGQMNPTTAEHCWHCGTDWEPWYAPSDNNVVSNEPKTKAVQKPKKRTQAEFNAEIAKRKAELQQQGKTPAEIDQILFGG